MTHGESARTRLGLSFWAVVLTAAAVRSIHLGTQSFWADEIATVHVGSTPILSAISWYFYDPHPPLFYTLIRAWIWFGTSEWWLRTFSVIAGTLAVAAVFVFARRFAGNRVAVLAGLLLAVNPQHVWVSQELRSMALLSLLSILSVHSFARYLDEGTRPLRRRFIGFTALMCYTHYYAFFVLGFEALWSILRGRSARDGRGALARAFGWIGVCYLPWLPFFLIQFHHGQSFRTFKSLADVSRRTLYYFTVSHSPWKLETLIGPLDRWYRTGDPRFHTAMLAALAPFAAMMFVGAIRSRKEEHGRGVLAGYALVSLGLLIAASRFVYLYEPRYAAGILPGFCVLAALGLSATWDWKKPAAILAGAWMLALSGVSLAHLYGDPSYHKPDWRKYGGLVSREATPDDAVLLYTMNTMNDFLYYYDGDAPVLAILPDAVDHAPVMETAAPVREALARLGGKKRIYFLDCLGFMHDPNGYAPKILSDRGRETAHYTVRDEMIFSVRVYDMNAEDEAP